MIDRECMRVNPAENGKQPPSSSVSADCSMDEPSTGGFQLKLQRDTLYVCGSDSSANSEWIVSYTTTGVPEARSTKREGLTQDGLFAMEYDDLDMRQSTFDDPFNISRLICSRMFSFGNENRVMRLFTYKPEHILTAIHGILMCSNIIKLSLCITKLSRVSSDIVFYVIQEQCAEEMKESMNYSIQNLEGLDEASLVSRFIGAFGPGVLDDDKKSSQLLIESDYVLIAAIRAISVLTFELRAAKSDLVYAVSIESLKDSVCLRVGMRCPPQRLSFVDGPEICDYVTESDKLQGSRILLFVNLNKFLIVQTTSAILRLLMAGYCGVVLQYVEADNVFAQLPVYEMLLIVCKYFDLELKFKCDQVEINRKSCTIDPFASKQNKSTNVDVEEDVGFPITVLGILDRIVALCTSNKKGVSSSPTCCAASSPTCLVKLDRSGEQLMEIISGLNTFFGFGEIRFTLKMEAIDANAMILLECIPPDLDATGLEDIRVRVSSMDRTTNVGGSCVGDVSPSNFVSVDLTVYGDDWESSLEEMESELEFLGFDDDRFSVLLVGPKLIGLGVCVIAESVGAELGGQFEVMCERAVRDIAGNTLKCAVRLFVKRVSAVSVVRGSSRLLVIRESDSRITLATNLFAALNEAPNASPYVLMEAKDQHCAFIGIMGIVVANGWSRSIHQRIETRIVSTPDEKILFVTRLVINTIL